MQETAVSRTGPVFDVAGSELINEVVRVFKVRRLYDEDHPQRVETETVAIDRIGELLGRAGAIDFEIREEQILWDEEVVYQQPMGIDSIAFLMYREGLRRLAFYPGLSREELILFLDHLAASTRPGLECELIARLWEEHLVNIRYAYVERLSDREWFPEVRSTVVDDDGDRDQPVITLDPADVVDLEDIPRISDAQAELFQLDDSDMEYLTAEVERERASELIDETLTCFRELLLHPPHDDPSPILSALETIQNMLLRRGDYARVRDMHAMFEPYTDRRDGDERTHAVFERLRKQSMDEDALQRLTNRVRMGESDASEAASYYRTFGYRNVAALLAGIHDVKRLCQESVLADVFTELARTDPDGVEEALRSSRVSTAASAAFLAGLLGDRGLIPALGRVLVRPEAVVRREALLALKSFDDPEAVRLVADRIDDEDPAIRLYALRHVTAHRYRPAFARVSELVERDAAAGRPATERRLLFEAYGALGGNEVVAWLDRRLNRKPWFFRRSDSETISCAAVGLAAGGTQAGREALRRAVESGGSHARDAASSALSSFSVGVAR